MFAETTTEMKIILSNILILCIYLSLSSCQKEIDLTSPGAIDSILAKIPIRYKFKVGTDSIYFAYKYDTLNQQITAFIDNPLTTNSYFDEPFEVYRFNKDGYLVSAWDGELKFLRNGNLLKAYAKPETDLATGNNYIDTVSVQLEEILTQTKLTTIARNLYYGNDTAVRFFRTGNKLICDSVVYRPDNKPIQQPSSQTAFTYDSDADLTSIKNDGELAVSIEYEKTKNSVQPMYLVVMGKDHSYLKPTAFDHGQVFDPIEQTLLLSGNPNNTTAPYEYYLQLFKYGKLFKSITIYSNSLPQTQKDVYTFVNTVDSSGRLIKIVIMLNGSITYHEVQLEYK